MLGITPINDGPGRLLALRTALASAFPSLVHKDGFMRDIGDHEDYELSAGVLMLVAGDEGDYSNDPGMEATEGHLSVALIIHFQVNDDNDGFGVETRELDLGEEIKTFVRSGVPGIGLTLERIFRSAQQETPYGWLVAEIDVGPPKNNH